MIGIDILEIERIKNIADDEKKLKKIFTKNEIKYFNNFENKYEHICGFFCAKEAVKKALDCPKNLTFLDIEILHTKCGKPYVKLNKKIDIKNQIKISISHSKTVATAVCLVI